MENNKAVKTIITIRMAGCILVGLIFLVLGAYLFFNPTEYEYTANAVIGSIEVTGGEWVDEGDTQVYRETYTVYVDYTFNGSDVKGAALDSYSSSMKVGDAVEIQFNGDDLMNVSQTGQGFLPIIIAAAGLISIVVGVFQIKRLPKARSRY